MFQGPHKSSCSLGWDCVLFLNSPCVFALNWGLTKQERHLQSCFLRARAQQLKGLRIELVTWVWWWNSVGNGWLAIGILSRQGIILVSVLYQSAHSCRVHCFTSRERLVAEEAYIAAQSVRNCQPLIRREHLKLLFKDLFLVHSFAEIWNFLDALFNNCPWNVADTEDKLENVFQDGSWVPLQVFKANEKCRNVGSNVIKEEAVRICHVLWLQANPFVPPLLVVVTVRLVHLKAVICSNCIFHICCFDDCTDRVTWDYHHFLAVERHIPLFIRKVSLREPDFLVISCVSMTKLAWAEGLIKDRLNIRIRPHKDTSDLFYQLS